MRPDAFTTEEEQERREAFNAWLLEHGDRLGFYLLPANRQGEVHIMLRKAFNAGFNFERRKHLPIIVGGCD